MPDQDDAELIACIRYLLGLRPLKPEPIGLAVFRFTLDGTRKLSRDEWARELGVTRQAVDQRYETLQRRLAAGDPQAYERAMAARQPRRAA